MEPIYEILARAAALRDETRLNSITPDRAGGIMYDTLIALNELWLQQGSALVISKIYTSVSAMEADDEPVSDITGQPLRAGQIVVIASSDSDNGSVYRFGGISEGASVWALVGLIGNITPVDALDSDSTQLPLAAHQGKVLDRKISQLGQELSFLLEDGRYIGGTTIGTSTIPDKTSSSDYKCILLEGKTGDKFVVKGSGGTSARLWYVYDKNRILTRVADAGVSTNSNPLTIEFGNNEQYLIVNALVAYDANVKYINISGVIANNVAKLNKQDNINSELNIFTDNFSNVSYYALTQGYYSGGTTINSSLIPDKTSSSSYECVKIVGKEGDKVSILGKGTNAGRLWYVYNSQGILVRVADADADTISSPVTITFGEDEKYLCVNVLKSFDRKVWMIRVPDTLNGIREGLYNSANNIEMLKGVLFEDKDISSNIDWTTGKFIKIESGNVTIVTTSAPNKVGFVDITGADIAKVKCSVNSGGNYSKLAYYFTDGSTVLSQSITVPTDTSYNSGELSLLVPNSAKYLYVSWDNSITSETEYPYVIIQTQKNASNDSVNLESTGVQLYEKVKYNNNDYSYTKFEYVWRASDRPNYQLPNPVVLNTLTDSNAASRAIQIADNATFVTPLTITLDLVSDNVTIYNLEPNKMYYYRVYKNGSTSNVLNSGIFDTYGHVRFLKIDATEDFTQDWIENVRDLGGWNANNNTKIRYGCIFRGHELNHITEGVETVYISNTGKSELAELGVSAELDLRGEPSVYTESVLGNDVAYYNIGLDLWFYRLNIYNYIKGEAQKFATAIRKVLEWLEAGKGIYVHCAGGCDRTGALSAMIEGLCGVSENDINHDYELSDRDRSREYYHITGNTDPATNKYDGDFKFAMEYIKGLIEYNSHIYVYYRNNYYDAEAVVTNYTPVPLTDASLISNLAENNYGSLQKRFERLLVGVGGLTMNEVERLRTVLCS